MAIQKQRPTKGAVPPPSPAAPTAAAQKAAALALAMPEPFLELRVHDLSKAPSVSGLCVGYEDGAWRDGQLAAHLMEWLPEFALNHTERASLNHASAVELLRRAAANVYTTQKFQKRGEFGELLLHAAIRQAFDSVPAVSKIYYKSANNDTVKGFDAVHVVGPPEDMELWLGEAKFYADITAAIRDVVAEIQIHSAPAFLRGEFIVINRALDPKHPHAAALKAFTAKNRSLDSVFKRTVIPVLLTYDSRCVTDHAAVTPPYEKAFRDEVAKHYAAFASKDLPKNIRIHLFLMPLKSKTDLVAKLDQQLARWRQI